MVEAYEPKDSKMFTDTGTQTSRPHVHIISVCQFYLSEMSLHVKHAILTVGRMARRI